MMMGGWVNHGALHAFGKDGMWAVADGSNHCAYIFDSKDQVITNFGTHGNGNGQFKYPRGVAFDDDNHLYVVNNNIKRVLCLALL